ncbi:hypothetical protein GF386_03515 [Candidatus Pacearchaeota archaeon]|nr:hypothetical protein [Candidatus Pacearchaeota archaeon]MBD3283219.1 hypothetical protein [Candidatus Pacearchaeota archaeon]
MPVEIFGANLKMNPVPDIGDRASFSEPLEDLLLDYEINKVVGNNEREIVIFAPLVYLHYLSLKREDFKKNNWRFGSQRVSRHDRGAYTGETSPIWLRNLGVTDVLIGHSEVREELEELAVSLTGIEGYDKEPIDRYLKPEIQKALERGLRVFYCVGETETEKQGGDTEEVLSRQLWEAFEESGFDEARYKLVIAYEPRWSIGGNELTPKPGEIEQAHRTIREVMSDIGFKDSQDLRILYGGSMNPGNVKEIMAVPGVSGGLIGSACLEGSMFGEVVNYAG